MCRDVHPMPFSRPDGIDAHPLVYIEEKIFWNCAIASFFIIFDKSGTHELTKAWGSLGTKSIPYF